MRRRLLLHKGPRRWSRLVFTLLLLHKGRRRWSLFPLWWGEQLWSRPLVSLKKWVRSHGLRPPLHQWVTPTGVTQRHRPDLHVWIRLRCMGTTILQLPQLSLTPAVCRIRAMLHLFSRWTRRIGGIVLNGGRLSGPVPAVTHHSLIPCHFRCLVLNQFQLNPARNGYLQASAAPGPTHSLPPIRGRLPSIVVVVALRNGSTGRTGMHAIPRCR